ncbi:E3 ubiquitin-protein ligase UBR4-like isoform X3 [Babylonia areolata]|uniref:E3 ubiquitin-protein ligase UBR4-like isoform X3 n=1 Tax=Babylonia areolata TaxID=304850 RepID=UPI003FD5080D
MATNAGLPWSVAIKPLLSTSYPSFPKSDIPEFTKAILRSERDILEHDEEYEPFYSSFVALSVHFLSTECITLSGSSLGQSSAACKVLLRFLLLRMQSRSESCTISQKYLMILIKGLCKGGGCLSKSDVVTFTSMMKASKQPPIIRGDAETSDTVTDPTPEQKDKKLLLRLDTGSNLFDQLTSVLDQATPVAKVDAALDPTHSSDTDGRTAGSEGSEDTLTSLARKNMVCLLQLNGANMLVEACGHLPFLSKFQQRYRDALTGLAFVLPGTLAEALTTRNLYQSLLSDVTVVWMAFSLPIIEPLTPKRLEQIITCTLTCLYAAVTVASADTIINMIKPATSAQPASKDEETEGYGRSIVQKALEIFNSVSVAVRNSTRAGGNVAQNLHLLAAWVLSKGLQGIMGHTPAVILERKDSGKREGAGHKAKETSRPLSTKSSHQGFSVTAVALASSALQLLTSLLEDLQIEGSVGDLEVPPGEAIPNLDIKLLTSMSAWQRVRRLLGTVGLVDLLFNLVMVSFRKAVMLKRTKQGSETAETSSSSTSDSNTFYEDDFSTTEDSSEEEDSEPILGEWLEGTLSPEEDTEPPISSPFLPRLEVQGESKRSRQPSTDEPPSLVPDKREPDGFIALASNVLSFMNMSIINSSDVNIRKLLKNSLSEEHVHILAGLVRDLDREIARSGHGEEDKMYEEVSISVAKFNHSLIATQSISEPLQDQLLNYLNVGTGTPPPSAAASAAAATTTTTTSTSSTTDPWPLTIPTHTLTLLVEILLLRQQRERERQTGRVGVDAMILSIWTRFLSSLKTSILNFDNRTEQFEDVNVEHLQVLIFLFHSLQLSHKKTLLVQVAHIIITVAEMDPKRLGETVPLPLSRLMLVFEYLLHYLYDPPPALMDQVQWNLFTVYTLPHGRGGEGGGGAGGAAPRTPQYFHCREVEDHFRKSILALEGTEVGNMKPRFYNLSPSDSPTQDVPKIDGLACTCLLSNQDNVDYGLLYSSCIRLLMAGSRCDFTKSKLSPLDASAMHYHFLLVWRLLACLPPSVSYVDKVGAGTAPAGSGFILHTLRWIPRLAHKAFIPWVKDCLIKQGLTAQVAEKKLAAATKSTDDITFDVSQAVKHIKQLAVEVPVVVERKMVGRKELPGLSTILILDAAVAKVQVVLDDLFSRSSSSSSGETESKKNVKVVMDLMPAVHNLIETYSMFVKSCVMLEVSESDDKTMTPQRLRAYSRVLSVGSSMSGKVAGFGSVMMSLLPSPVKNAIEKWGLSAINEFPPMFAWRNAFANDTIPCESYMDAIHSAHMITLSGQQSFCIHASIRHVLSALVSFGNNLLTWSTDTMANKEFTKVLLPLLFDATTEHMAESVMYALERVIGSSDSDDFNRMMYEHAVAICHDIIVTYSDAESGLDEKILQECIRFIDSIVENLPGARALDSFYSRTGELTNLLLCVAREGVSAPFVTKVLKFFNKLFQLAEKEGSDKCYSSLCGCLSGLAKVDPSVLQSLLYKIFKPPQEEEEEDTIKQNRHLLHSLTVYIVKDSSRIGEDVAMAVLSALIPMGAPLLKEGGGDLSGFPELMMVMQALALAGKAGHLVLFQATTEWLQLCKDHLSEKEVREHLVQSGKPSSPGLLETLCCLLSYIGDVLAALKKGMDRGGAASPTMDVDTAAPADADSDWAEDMTQEEDDSGGEDSDEESLNNKLCTFTITQKEFMNQHWYHCHTCKMVDGVGVCTVCAKVCHKDHDLSYAKFGSFFCDCGAKEDGSCKALVKRTAQSGIDSSGAAIGQSPFAVDTFHHHSSLRRRLSSPGPDDKPAEAKKTPQEANEVQKALLKQIEESKGDLLSHMEQSNVVQTVLDILQWIVPPLTDNYQDASPMGSTARAQKALADLHMQAKKIETTSDQLMTVTLGSQEGAFENVRMNYSGDQGQTIRQLITAHMLRRVAMCVLSSPQGKRQHLAVSHEKGKITILQLSALLKQADSSKKKLTLTRLSSAPIPFTVLSIVGNPCNEDFLAVCGLKDCHVLTFTGSGTVSDHLVLHPSLATGNFIIKAVWLPGSQTELAIVTADFVKIYDLSIDAISPQYYFLLPSGKIRDATFLFGDEGRHMILMASSGYIYTQVMEDSSSARHGPFYITNVLEAKHTDLKDVNGQVAGGGVSVYYSHALQLLFFSYSQGKSFSAPVARDLSKVTNLFPITFKCSNGGGKGTSGSNQALVQWSEVPGHTGLLYCMGQTSNNPIVLMVRPDAIVMQEIKVIPAKAKIQDVVAIRHIASTSDQQQRTTMILLCEDGSLRIYMANVDNTNYWMSPFLQPQSPIAALKPVKKKKQVKSGRPVGSVNFPIDFFEHCQQSSDVEFGSNDVLQVYNTQQVKHRLNTTGMYIASSRSAGFSLEMQNTNAANVMVGLRVLMGSQTTDKAPSYLEIFGRTIPVSLTRARWFDLPFTREESLTADKKATLFVGSSSDPAGITMLDSVKVYVKTKEAFGWPEEPDEFPEPTLPSKVTPTSGGMATASESDSAPTQPIPMTSADRLLGSGLEVLDGAFATVNVPDTSAAAPPKATKDVECKRAKALELATKLLTLPSPLAVQQHVKSLLASLFPTKQAYHNHKDQALLEDVMQRLTQEGQAMAVESFQRLVVTARSVAVTRPTNLLKFAETGHGKEEVLELMDLEMEKEEKSADPGTSHMYDLDHREQGHFTSQLMTTFWKLHAAKPANPMLAPVCLPGLAHIDATVRALVEIISAFCLCDTQCVTMATKHLVHLLLCPDVQVSGAACHAIIRALRPRHRHRRRRVFIPTPPTCSSPGPGGGDDDDDDDDDDDKGDKPDTPSDDLSSMSQPAPADGDMDNEEVYEENVEPMVLELGGEGGAQANPLPGGLEALWSGERNFPPIVDIPPDADDETMVELAIALSLQDQSGQARGLGLQGLGLAAQANEMMLEEAPLSDTTASAPGSDDEVGSNAATDGSTLRTSPAEHAGSAGSESGGSAVDSISATSGRSSAYGFQPPESLPGVGGRSETSSVGGADGSIPPEQETFETEAEADVSSRLHSLRLLLLERMLQYLREVGEVGGERAVPFMQVLLMLTSDMDSEEDRDRAVLDTFLSSLVHYLDLTGKDLSCVGTRCKKYEAKLIILRLLSVLLSRTRGSSKSSGESSFVTSKTASALLASSAIPYCLQVLQKLLPYWRQYDGSEEELSAVSGQLLKPHPSHPPPDMSPFFLRQYVKCHANDVFEEYPQLLTEMVLRLPYQLKKIAESGQKMPLAVFDLGWHSVLSEYMMTQQTPFMKRQVRKLLLFICGSKEKYRQLRDEHAVESHLAQVREIGSQGGWDQTMDLAPHSIVLPYDTLLTLIEHLKVCSEIATSRPYNWQTYCRQHQETLPYIVCASIVLDEGVAPTLLTLLQVALCGVKGQGDGQGAAESSSSTASISPVKVDAKKVLADAKKSKSKAKKKKKKEDKKDSAEGEPQKFDEGLSKELVELLIGRLDNSTLVKFVRTFLLESNASGNRWLAHSLVLRIYQNSTAGEQEALLDLLWGLWEELPVFGRKAAQFVDLLGYFVLKTPSLSEQKVQSYLEKAVSLLRGENNVLAHHPNASIYNMLQGLVDFDGYYLESDPCLVCNNPEVPYTNLKLSAVKVDSKFTTTTQIVKLVGSHTISKISLRISDLKRTKMVRTLNIYYNNRSVQAVVELKNRPGLWHKAKKVTLTTGQTDIKVEFPIPIVACNLMLEYADFYDNLQATTETLQCPRCSASVPATPGVCGNCGENVYQCHKCRAINYDEKDPFLCNACGFCKYAKFDLTLLGKPCCAVDPIENEEDRKKAISTINLLLEKADRTYKQLQTHRPILESLLIQVTEHSADRLTVSQRDEANNQSSAVPASNVNKAIQLLAQKYCGECKSAFDELSNIIQKVMACRRELVEYDQQQREAVASKVQGNMPGAMARPKVKEVPGCKASISAAASKKDKEGKANTCFGCASAAVEHCITLLRALVTNPNMRQILCSQGMIQQLIDYNLRHGALSVRLEVRSLLCLLTRDNRRATEEMNNLIMTRITAAVKGHQSNPDMASSVRHEIMLLSSSLQQEDTCWEQRVRCVMRLFLMGMHMRSPIIMESITLPCLRILQGLIKQDLVTFLGKKREELDPAEGQLARFHMDVRRWLEGDPDYSFTNWKKRLPTRVTPAEEEKLKERKEVRARYLTEKYVGRWRQRMWRMPEQTVCLTQTTWLHTAIFSPSSRSARQTACSVVESISQLASHRKEVIDMLTGCLEQVGRSGECANEFLALYKRLIAPAHWKIYLAVKGVLQRLGTLITQEVEHLQHLEETTLSSDLAQGYALKALTELLWLFVEHEQIKNHYKNKLVGFILNGYLSLRKLVVQRTKLIDETQERLLELLEELTTGTESETTEFMSVCVQTVQKYPLDDYRSPVFIFERLCSIIYPEENDVGEFFMILEKDPQQEDFLQGRMLGNPYSSNEPGLGPLMRDIKNKICQDCELVALLEDDTGMELLVNKKIISLDLPVKEVYKKVWLPEHGEGEPMPIVYRMRGLLGDATEDMVNSLDTGNEEDIDKEAVFKMAAELKECGGLPVMLERLASVRDLVLGRQLMCVLLKLFSYAVNVKVNRQELIRPELNTVNIMLGALNLALWAEPEGGSGVKGQTITEQILNILEVILLEASEQPPELYSEFSKLCGDRDQLKMLLDRINSSFVQSTPSVRQALMRLIPFLAFGDPEKMLVLINHFSPYLDFDRFDKEQGQDEQNHLDCFSVIACGIESNANGERLKDVIYDHGVVQKAVDYILRHAPQIKTMLSTDSEVWKEFVSKPCLSYALRILTGLCIKHTKTIHLIAEKCVPILHKLEQVSSDKHVGTLAENLLDALRDDPSAAQKIEDVRQETKAEKKRLAMAVRKKHLGALGMTTNEKGQVTVKSSVLKQMEDLKEETGLTCCICREGYRYQPQKVLAVYTFSKRCNLDEYENKPRKTPGYSTVSHFNVVHVDCHTAAVRHARGREEWESATLQNANTKCNGLLPLWGPQVQESVFAACLARHNNYLQECTGVRDIGYTYTIHDIKLLLLRLAQERSFSNESGGGGRQSNVHILPFMMHITLYVINTTRAHGREDKNITNFLDMPKSKWVENCFETEGPLYYLVLAMHMLSPARWKELRSNFFQRLLIMAHVRATCQSSAKTPADKEMKNFQIYKMYLVFFGFIAAMYEKVFKKLTLGANTLWCNVLAEYIRLNDRLILDSCDRALSMFETELLPCESFEEYLDVVGMLEEIPNAEEYLTQSLASLP